MSLPLPRYRNDPGNYVRPEQPATLARILRETGATAPDLTTNTATRADHTDRARLRGIPVAGGACGTSPGTDPLHALLRGA